MAQSDRTEQNNMETGSGRTDLYAEKPNLSLTKNEYTTLNYNST